MKEEKTTILSKFLNETSLGIFLRDVFGNGTSSRSHAMSDGIDEVAIEKAFRESSNNIAKFPTSFGKAKSSTSTSSRRKAANVPSIQQNPTNTVELEPDRDLDE